MTDALLPCPFCGGVQIEAFHHIDRGWGASWHVQCVAEECGNSTCHHDTEANAITAWNKRQPTQIDVERVARALAQADGIEICGDATYALSSYGHRAQAALAAMRQPTQSDAALDAEGVKLYWYRQGKDDGVEHERAKILAWLRKQDGHGYDAMRAECIEAGEHLK